MHASYSSSLQLLTLLYTLYWSWLVLQCTGRTEAADSLFTYGDGEDHASINDDSSYTPVFGVDPNSVPENVKATCGDNKECLFDYAQTNDMDFAMSTMGEVEEQEELRKILSEYHHTIRAATIAAFSVLPLCFCNAFHRCCTPKDCWP